MWTHIDTSKVLKWYLTVLMLSVLILLCRCSPCSLFLWSAFNCNQRKNKELSWRQRVLCIACSNTVIQSMLQSAHYDWKRPILAAPGAVAFGSWRSCFSSVIRRANFLSSFALVAWGPITQSFQKAEVFKPADQAVLKISNVGMLITRQRLDSYNIRHTRGKTSLNQFKYEYLAFFLDLVQSCSGVIYVLV